jgi:hypothetical protein
LRSLREVPDDSDTAVSWEALMSSYERIVTKRRDLLRVAGAALATASLPLPVLAQGAPLKIGMIGSGREGSALGTLFAKAGHKVMFSSRHPEELKGLVEGIGPAAQAGTVEQRSPSPMSWRSSCRIQRCSRSARTTPQHSPASNWCSMSATRSNGAMVRTSSNG